MQQLAWLHLSDWHQQGPDFDRDRVRDALLADIGNREGIDPGLGRIDLVIFSGDLAHGGKAEEFARAREALLDPVLQALGLGPDRLFLVPGNHDLDRGHVYDMLPPGLQRPFIDSAEVKAWLTDPRKRARALEPFHAYRDFVAGYTGQPDPDYASVLRLNLDEGPRVALLGINSAWMCARHKDDKGEVDDARRLVIGEPQIHQALAAIADADVRIAVLHHPFDWLADFDRNPIKSRLCRACHFILRGHEHQPQVEITTGTAGDCVIIPAGACFDRRRASDPRYTNAYNWVRLDLGDGTGIVHLRRWSEGRGEWIEDVDSWPGGRYELPRLPKGLGPVSLAVVTESGLPPAAVRTPPEPNRSEPDTPQKEFADEKDAETREQQQLRILTSRPRDKGDWEETKYLKEKGLCKAKIVLDTRRSTRGQVLHLVWEGITAKGRDYVDALRARANRDDAKAYADQQRQGKISGTSPEPNPSEPATPPIEGSAPPPAAKERPESDATAPAGSRGPRDAAGSGSPFQTAYENQTLPKGLGGGSRTESAPPPTRVASCQPPQTGGALPSPAAAIWRERLEFLQAEEAKAVSAAERFAIKKQIEEARARLEELS